MNLLVGRCEGEGVEGRKGREGSEGTEVNKRKERMERKGTKGREGGRKGKERKGTERKGLHFLFPFRSLHFPVISILFGLNIFFLQNVDLWQTCNFFKNSNVEALHQQLVIEMQLFSPMPRNL